MIVAGRNGVMYERKAVYVVCYRVRNFVECKSQGAVVDLLMSEDKRGSVRYKRVQNERGERERGKRLNRRRESERRKKHNQREKMKIKLKRVKKEI